MKTLLQCPINFISLFLIVNFFSVKNSLAQSFETSQLVTLLSANQNGIPDTLDYGGSCIDKMKHLIVATNTKVGNTTDLLVTKYALSGAIDWVHTYNSLGNSFDYGTAVATDDSDNIYVAGTSVMPSNSYDYIVRKYDSSGTVKWTVFYNGPGSSYDVATDIKFFNGYVYVTGTSMGSGTGLDYCTLKYNRGGGSPIWTSRYDYNSLIDIAATLSIASDGNIIVSGGSDSTLTDCDFATVKYKASSGGVLNVTRNSSPGLGVDLPTCAVVDADGNIYVCGRAAIPSHGYDIKLVKLDSSLHTVWSATWDNVHLNDQANSVGVDAIGNVYVTGYTTKLNSGSDYITIKYNSSGTKQWQERYSAPDTTKFAQARDLDIDPYGKILVTGSVYNISNKDFLTLAYDTGGNKVWEEWFDGNGKGDDYASTVRVDTDHVFYVMGRVWSDTVFRFATLKYRTIDYITPPDTEDFANSFAYYQNKGQLIGTNDSLQPGIKFYSMNHYPEIYFKNDTQSFVFSHIDTAAATDDTLHKIHLTLKNSLATKVYNTSATVPGYLNYFKPWCPHGVTGVRGFQRLLYPEVYSNIDLMVYGNGAGIKYYFIVKPGGDAKKIILQFTGSDTTKILGSGKLEIVSALGSLTFEPPTAFQIDTDGSVINFGSPTYYTSGGANKIEFHTPSWNMSLPMIIEVKKGPPPSPNGGGSDNLKWSTYFGGPNANGMGEECSDIKTDDLGNIYVSGISDYHAFPIATGVTSGTLGFTDAFAVKFSPIAVPQWISYYAGSGYEFSTQIVVGGGYKVYISGTTTSTDLPLVDFNPGVSFYHTSGGGFIARFNESGDSLEWSSYIPGIASLNQMVLEYQADAVNEIFIVGGFASAGNGFPLHQAGSSFYQTSGSGCGYILSFFNDCTENWGTLFGQGTELWGVSFSSDLSIYVTGRAGYAEPMILANPVPGTSCYQDSISSANDIVIAKFNGDKTLYWGTYYGGINDDYGRSIVVDDDDNIFVGGYENDLTHSGAPLPLYNNIAASYFVDSLPDDWNGVILEFAPEGAPLWGTLYGGITDPPVNPPGPDDYIYSLTAFHHQIFGAGFTRSADLPHHTYYDFYDDDALQIGTLSGSPVNNGDGFTFSFSSSGDLLYSAYFGGDGSEGIRRIYCGGQNLFLVGQVNNIDTVDIPLHEVDPFSPDDFYQPLFSETQFVENYDGFISELGLEELTGIQETETGSSHSFSLICFPNPAHSEIYFKVPSSLTGNCSISIFNTTGAIIYKNNIKVHESIYKIDESLPQGIYLVSIQNSNLIVTGKVIIQ